MNETRVHAVEDGREVILWRCSGCGKDDSTSKQAARYCCTDD